MNESNSKIKNGLVWNSINHIAKYGLQFCSVMILARLLTPHDYGLIGLITIFISVSEGICDSGLGGAIIKKADAKTIDYSTLFVYNTVVSIFLFIVIFFCAPYLDFFYKEDCLGKLLRLYSVVLIIHAATIVPRLYMTKRFLFKELSIINTISNFFGLVGAILLAYMGFGPYSLVWQHIIYALFMNVLILYRSKYHISLGFSIISFKEQFSFGINTTIANTLKSFTENIYNNFIGKSSSVVQSGYYAQGTKIMQVPVLFFHGLIDTTFFPVLSQIQDISEFRKKICSLNTKTMSVIILIFIFLIPNSKEIIYVLLGEKWLDASWTLTILFISGLFITWGNIGRNVIKCTGKTYIILKYEIFMFLLAMLGLLFTYKLGYKPIVLCFLAISFVKSVIINLLACKELETSLIKLLKPLREYLISMVFICSFLFFFEIENRYLSLVVKIGVSILCLIPVIKRHRINFRSIKIQ